MTRILLAITVIIALGVLLWGSWQWGKKPFISALCLVLLIVLGLLGVGIWHSEQDNLIAMAPEGITLQLEKVGRSGRSTRITGQASNNGELAVSRMWVRVQALHCPQAEQCQPVQSEELPVSLYLPAGATYHFSLMTGVPQAQDKVDRWHLEVLEVLAFPREERR